MALPRPPKPPRAKLPGQRAAPTANQRRKPRKPRVVSAAERTIKFVESLNPFD